MGPENCVIIEDEQRYICRGKALYMNHSSTRRSTGATEEMLPDGHYSTHFTHSLQTIYSATQK